MSTRKPTSSTHEPGTVITVTSEVPGPQSCLQSGSMTVLLISFLSNQLAFFIVHYAYLSKKYHFFSFISPITVLSIHIFNCF